MFRRRRPRWVAICFTVVVGLIAWRVWVIASTAEPTNVLPEGVYRVAHIEPDLTFVLESGVRLRLLGVTLVNAKTPQLSPEQSESVSAEAKTFLSAAIPSRSVRIQFDRERMDRSGTLLAYLFVPEVGQEKGSESLLNESLISSGWAVVERGAYFNESHKRHFRQAEDDARKNVRGIWSLNQERKEP